MTVRRCFAALLLVLTAGFAAAAEPPSPAERARWFRDAKFGLFLHWGVFSVLGEGEWVMHVNKIPVAEYEKLPAQFNPTGWDPKEWVALAKRAGAKYLVFTAKHHDGFCMFDSQLADFTVTKATPFKRDVVGELVRECQKQGLKVGLYYSILDWHHPDFTPPPPWDKSNPRRKEADFQRYLKYMEGQIRELCTNYGKIDLLWFDGAWHHQAEDDKKEFARINALVRQLQPGILINDRANIAEDFATPEQHVPPAGPTTADGKPRTWEACLTLTAGHGSHAPTAWWGYDKNEKVFKTKAEVIRTLVNVVSKGGNLLLGAGPAPTGKIRPEVVANLEAVGAWLRVNGPAIYGTSASPFRHLGFWGRVTTKGNRLYLHVFDRGDAGVAHLPGLSPKANAVTGRPYLLADPKTTLGFRFDDVRSREGKKGGESPIGLDVNLPDKLPDPVATVVVVDLKKPPVVGPVVLRPGADKVLKLPVLSADLHGQHGQRARYEANGGKVHVTAWSNKNDYLTWDFEVPLPGTYEVILLYACADDAAGGEVAASVGKQELKAKVSATGGAFKEASIGQLSLREPGKHTLTLKALAIPKDKVVLRLREIVLRPAEPKK